MSTPQVVHVVPSVLRASFGPTAGAGAAATREVEDHHAFAAHEADVEVLRPAIFCVIRQLRHREGGAIG